jgi:hypothetical protein
MAHSFRSRHRRNLRSGCSNAILYHFGIRLPWNKKTAYGSSLTAILVLVAGADPPGDGREYGGGRERSACDAYHSTLLFFALAGSLDAALLV